MANWILFGVFALFVVINAIVGLIRGLNKSVVRLMLIAPAVLLTFFIAGPVTTLVANSVTIEGQTLGQMVLESVNADGSMDMVFQLVPLIRELILVVPAFVISLVVFPLVFGILKFLTWIAFLFAQKPLRKLIFKETRTKEEDKALPKKTRMISRFSGLGVGIVTGMIIFGMIFTPVFGVFGMLPGANQVNSVMDILVQFNGMTASDADMVKEIYSLTDGGVTKFYGFFGAKGTGKLYINSATKVEHDGVKTSLGNELGTLLELVQTMLQTGMMLNTGDPNAYYNLINDPAALEEMMQTMFQSKVLRAAVPEILATSMGSAMSGMGMPADKDAVYDNMMEEVSLSIQNADINYAGVKAYEDANGSSSSLTPIAVFSKISKSKLTQKEYEAEIGKLVVLAKTVSTILDKALAGDNVAFTDSVAAYIVVAAKDQGKDAASFDVADVQAVIADMGADQLEGEEAEKLLEQLKDKDKFETELETVADVVNRVREAIKAAVADDATAAETASVLSSVVSDVAGAIVAATDTNGQVDVTKVDFNKIASAITKLQHSPIKPLGTVVLEMVAASDSQGMLGNVVSALKEGYEKGEDIGGTIGTAGALISFGAAISDTSGNNQEAIVNSVTSLIQNLNEFTIGLLPTIFSDETIASLGVPAEMADATYNVLETLLKELLKLKGAEDYSNEVNAIVSLYNLFAVGAENLNEDIIAELFSHAKQSDAIYNTLISISKNNPFGVETPDAAARAEMAKTIKDAYLKTGKTDKDKNIATSIAALMGVKKELKLK